MGAGSYLAGVGLAGHSPTEIAATSGGAGTVTGVPMFDPLTKSYPDDGDGGVEEASAIWQEVAHRLGIPLGAIPSAATVGIDVARARAATPANAESTIEDVVTVALQPMSDRGDVNVARVVLAKPGRGKWESHIPNLREPDPQLASRVFGSP